MDYMKDVLGESFVYTIGSYFKGKDILLIFDDFEYHTQEVEFFDHIFVHIKESHTKFIFITRSKFFLKEKIHKNSVYFRELFNQND